MPGRPQSEEEKHQHLRETKDKWTNRAAELYAILNKDDEESGEEERLLHPHKGYRYVAEYMEDRCWEEDRIHINIDKQTVKRRAEGVPSQAQSNWDRKAWLTTEEADSLINYALQLGREGWPFSAKRLEEHANEICRGRYGESFGGVGHNWTARFALKHKQRLKPCWSRPLDDERARAANPTTKADYFAKLEEALKGEEGEEPVAVENIYGVDETGIQQGVGVKERVYGDKDTKFQHQKRSGGRENITVIATICADGTANVPPAVIYKGSAYHTSWKQDNPLNASLGYSKKGYTNGEIGVEWIKHFDQQTREKAGGRRRLLLVDGHNSHYTRGFLEYARENKISVLCYPSHSTHLYQGLDVVIFSLVKRNWSTYRDDHERKTGSAVKKDNFLAVYAQAHLASFTQENILSAFKKTGVVPYNPNVIPEAALATSRTSSSTAGLPVEPPSPVRIMSDMIHRVIARQTRGNENDGTEPDSATSPSFHEAPNLAKTPVRVATAQLASTSASNLVSSTPIRSSSPFPRFHPYTISPFQKRNTVLLDIEPHTELEMELHAALIEANERDDKRKHQMVAMQSNTILQDMYVRKVNGQLHWQEKEAEKKKKKQKRFSGTAKLLTGDQFFAQVVEEEDKREREAKKKEENKARRAVHAAALAEWKTKEARRKKHNETIRSKYRADVALWEEERDAAKAEKRRTAWNKPHQGKLQPAIPRPKIPQSESDSEEESDSEGGEEEGDSDGDGSGSD